MRDCVFIVGGGPSLTSFDFNRLRNRDTIVVNDSVFHTPNPVAWISMDYTWMLKHDIKYGKVANRKDTAFFNRDMKRYFLVSFGGERLRRIENGIEDVEKGVKYDLRLFDRVVYASAYGGFGGTFEDFRTGSDSGYAAVQLAAALGYKCIYLLGLDFVVEDTTKTMPMPGPIVRLSHGIHRLQQAASIKLETRTHFHTVASRSIGNGLASKLREFITPYPEMLKQAQSAGLKIVSCSRISKLNQWIPFQDLNDLA